jgi:hypothetical protein
MSDNTAFAMMVIAGCVTIILLAFAPVKTNDFNCPKVRIVEWQRASGRNQFEPAYSIVQTIWDEEAGMCTNGTIGGK